MSELSDCYYCRLEASDYNIDCKGCRDRFRRDHHDGRFMAAKHLDYHFRTDTSILQVIEEHEG